MKRIYTQDGLTWVPQYWLGKWRPSYNRNGEVIEFTTIDKATIFSENCKPYRCFKHYLMSITLTLIVSIAFVAIVAQGLK